MRTPEGGFGVNDPLGLAKWGQILPESLWGTQSLQGEKQIVIGLLCDEAGEPVSTEVFRGNTEDT